MPRVIFTPNLRKHLDCPPVDVPGADVRSALESVFVTNPRLRGYILDDQARLRQHVTVFIDNRTISDRQTLSDLVSRSSEIYVMQALSGG